MARLSLAPRALLVLRALLSLLVLLALPALPALLGSCEPPQAKPVAGANSPSYAQRIAPIFAQRCTGCHGDEKQKGKLALNRPEAISKGGADGIVIVPGKPQASDLVRRLKLPIDDEDHMPPKDRPQPSADEIAALEEWIAAGASFEGGEVPVPETVRSTSAPVEKVSPADPKAIAALEAALVHVEQSDPMTGLLWIDFAATATKWNDADLEQVLAPLAAQVSELSLARTHAGLRTLTLAARMPRLAQLDLRATAVDDAALACLRGHARIERLVLARTSLTDAGVETLLALPALKRVYLWQSGITPAGIARLASERPKLVIVAGDESAAAALETEPAPNLTNQAPVPGADAKPAATGAAALAPINTVCPVSGKPVDAKYSIVFEGRVIGFCCNQCPTEFRADPAKFRSKLP